MGGIVRDIWEKSNFFGSLGSQKGAKNWPKKFYVMQFLLASRHRNYTYSDAFLLENNFFLENNVLENIFF